MSVQLVQRCNVVLVNACSRFNARVLTSKIAKFPIPTIQSCGNDYRTVNQVNTRGCCTKSTGSQLNEVKQTGNTDVLKTWTKSILTQGLTEGSSIGKDCLLKRPPVGVGAFQNSGKSEGVRSSEVPTYRRRLSDNTWATAKMDDKIIWVDCEMTGLDPSKDLLIEIGVIITDADLNVIATQDSIVFHAEDSVLNGMDAWCLKHHGDSGLIDACKNSKITHEIADEQLLKFLQKYTTAGECPMAGNSIGQDRGFIRRQLPKFHSHFHYRDIDVSSIKELARRWFPDAYRGAPRKKRAHRVLDDINDSIEELKFYRSTVFASPTEVSARVAAVISN